MKRAFSLIEILVVTAIIALLAALLFPVFAQAKKNAYTTTCISNFRQYGLSIQLYQNDFEDKLPVGTILKWRNQKGDGTFFPEDSTRDMIRPLKSYGGGDAAFRCPHRNQLFLARWIVRLNTNPGESRIIEPLPNTALAECHHHLTQGWYGASNWESYVGDPAHREGFHLVLRADGSVGKVNAHAVKQYTYKKVNGIDVWTLCNEIDDCYPSRDVFPDEAWPPTWKVLPEDISVDWNRL